MQHLHHYCWHSVACFHFSDGMHKPKFHPEILSHRSTDLLSVSSWLPTQPVRILPVGCCPCVQFRRAVSVCWALGWLGRGLCSWDAAGPCRAHAAALPVPSRGSHVCWGSECPACSAPLSLLLLSCSGAFNWGVYSNSGMYFSVLLFFHLQILVICACRCCHVNILQLLGFSVETGLHCLIYPYLPNGSLQNKLQCRVSK